MSQRMRVYVPLTLARLRSFVGSGQLRPAGGLVFGVTPSLQAEYPAADLEELEYLALADASRTSLVLLAAEDGGQGWLRVVVAADVDDAVPAPERERSAAVVSAPVPWLSVASVHLDGAETVEVVRKAALAVDAADLGDPDAELAVGDAEDVDLSWYAPGEVSFLLADLEGPG